MQVICELNGSSCKRLCYRCWHEDVYFYLHQTSQTYYPSNPHKASVFICLVTKNPWSGLGEVLRSDIWWAFFNFWCVQDFYCLEIYSNVNVMTNRNITPSKITDGYWRAKLAYFLSMSKMISASLSFLWGAILKLVLIILM